MLRGEVRVVDLEPAWGSETGERRPTVVVSNDGIDRATARLGRGMVTVVPLTTNTARVRPFQVLLAADETGLRDDSKAQPEQVRAVDVSRVGPPLGRLGWSRLAELDDALRLHLDL